MDEVPILGQEEARSSWKLFQAQYDAPAYVRRARNMEGCQRQLEDRCRKARAEMLSMVRLRLGILFALVGEPKELQTLIAQPDQRQYLVALHDELQPKLRVPVAPTRSRWRLRSALRDLRESMLRFNPRWEDFLRQQDLTEINQAREEYNRWYLLEKECAVRNPRIAREGFVRQPPFTMADLQAAFPLLVLPEEKR